MGTTHSMANLPLKKKSQIPFITFLNMPLYKVGYEGMLSAPINCTGVDVASTLAIDE